MITYDPARFTYGAELELADIDSRKGLPSLPDMSGILGTWGWDRRDYSMVNSSGIAVDPKHKSWHLGGEVNTPATETIAQQVALFSMVKAHWPEATINYRCNLHIHVGVPGLRRDLEALKRLQRFIHLWMPHLLPIVEPISEPASAEIGPQDEDWSDSYSGALKRYRRRRVSHHTLLSDRRIVAQQCARTVEEFLELEVPKSKKGDVIWHAQPRCCVNLRQLRETGTIEFRHFPGTLDTEEFRAALIWCGAFLTRALNTGSGEMEQLRSLNHLKQVAKELAARPGFPKFDPYNHELELRYLRTCHDGSNRRPDIEAAIREITNG